METRNKRIVFLLGAGAAIDWKGPTTKEITNHLLNNGPKNSNGVYVTTYIVYYFKIRTNIDLNFEGLIDVVEQCLQYWYSKGKSHNINSILISPEDDFWKNTIDYDYLPKDGGGEMKTLVRSIVNSNKYNAEAKFFIYLLAYVYDEINGLISVYSRKSSFDSFVGLNTWAGSYFKKLSKDNYLRVYSLNYDNIIQQLFDKEDIRYFEGFDRVAKIDSFRILTSWDENCIYHLHGNHRWHLETTTAFQITEFLLGKFTFLQSRRPFSLFNSEKDKPLLASNIISGYSKTQRTNIAPFKQMVSAFDLDCHRADEIIVVGYSYGDIHINYSLSQIMETNPNSKITFIGLYSADDEKRIRRELKFKSIDCFYNKTFKDYLFGINSN